MSYYGLFALVTLAGFFVALVGAGLATAAIWPALRAHIDSVSAPRRATWLLALRVAPTAFAVALALAVGVAFLRFEPSEAGEGTGVLLMTLAACAVVLGASAGVRAVRLRASESALFRLMRQCRQWTSNDGSRASILDTPYPVAAVAGVLHPRLMLSARVLHECTAEEISAIVAHEHAHVRRRDNLVRALFSALPDRGIRGRLNREIETAWTRAAEEAADDDAAGRSEAPRAALAATLIRVSRMADQPPPSWMPELAFYQGADLERRVRALLAAPRRDGWSIVCLEWAALASATTVALLILASTPTLHRLTEWSVRYLP